MKEIFFGITQILGSLMFALLILIGLLQIVSAFRRKPQINNV